MTARDRAKIVEFNYPSVSLLAVMSNSLKLAAPGAGLPFPENLVFRLFGKRMLDRRIRLEDAVPLFLKEGHEALNFARKLDFEKLCRPVLIDRIRGIEDSSRNWSVAMTLQHLMIVGKPIMLTAMTLCKGKTIDRIADPGTMKPNPETGPKVVDEFSDWLEKYENSGLESLNFSQQPTHRHPWFGDLSAAQWLKLNAAHNRLHRLQIEKIIEGL